MWAQIMNTLLGLWLMSAPDLFVYGETTADNGHIIGPVVVTFSVTSLWQCTRGMRRWNYPLAVWLLMAPWILDYQSTVAIISDTGSGLLILIFSSVRGKISKRYGGGWSSLWGKDNIHAREANN